MDVIRMSRLALVGREQYCAELEEMVRSKRNARERKGRPTLLDKILAAAKRQRLGTGVPRAYVSDVWVELDRPMTLEVFKEALFAFYREGALMLMPENMPQAKPDARAHSLSVIKDRGDELVYITWEV